MSGLTYQRLLHGDKILDPPKFTTLVNLLPFDIVPILLQGDYGNGQFKPISYLKAGQTLSIPSPPTSLGTKITCIKAPNSSGTIVAKIPNEMPLTMPIQFGYAEKYFFGAVAWNSFDMDTNGYNLYADMPGIRIYNHFPFEVTVNYKNISFQIGPDSWRDYLGGSKGMVYFDNQGNGIDVGDVFNVTVAEKTKPLVEFKIPNKNSRNVHIGMTSTP